MLSVRFKRVFHIDLGIDKRSELVGLQSAGVCTGLRGTEELGQLFLRRLLEVGVEEDLEIKGSSV